MSDTSRGIDVSAYQGVQDWEGLARGGLSFAFAKASEGQHSRDARFGTHISGIIKAGLIPGAYHYGWPSQSPATEAANYVAAVRPYARRGFIHILDLERRTDGANYAGRSHAQIRAWADTWITAVTAAFPGQRVGIYTSGDDITSGHLPGNAGFLWYPAYPSGAMTYAEAEAHARPAPSGLHPLFWQFTSTPVDRSIAYLSPAALRAWALGDTTSLEAPVSTLDADDLTKVREIVRTELQGLLHVRLESLIAPDRTRYLQDHLRGVDVLAQIRGLAAQVGAQSGLITALTAAVKAGGGLTAEQATAAAEAGARAALDQLADALTKES